MLLATTRIARRWNQTGQKHAGGTDIAKHFLPAHRVTLWILVVAMFLHLTYRIIQRRSPKVIPSTAIVITVFTCLTTFVFKAAFATADSPELLLQFPEFILRLFEDIPLIYQARLVFSGLGLSCTYIVSRRIYYKMRVCVFRSSEYRLP